MDGLALYLPVEASLNREKKRLIIVGPMRFELMASAMSRRRHNQLDHGPLDANNL